MYRASNAPLKNARNGKSPVPRSVRSTGLSYVVDFRLHSHRCFSCHALCKVVIDDIAEGSKLIIALGPVHPIVYGDEVNIMLREHDLGIHAHLQIITAKAGHIFNDDPFDQARFNIGDHLLETRPIEGRSRNAVVNVKAEVGVPVFKSVLL